MISAMGRFTSFYVAAGEIQDRFRLIDLRRAGPARLNDFAQHIHGGGPYWLTRTRRAMAAWS